MVCHLTLVEGRKEARPAQQVPKLFGDLALARGDGRYARTLRGLAEVQLLILDDWRLEPVDAGAVMSFSG